ncbi:nitroreductase [Aliishimia ponticola]|uniref:Putative NAD(P)H nitroreductase n=1 Tax=Aliishimia ponticola TaxID=2499833 RepID=A0A4S4NB23_9RHOB|nr:nitroreductase [Aliishimia ponticola]THH36576.1 nitroreductase [Aliishimia ponticola]
MPEKNPAALEFLLTRRSRPAKTLTAPAPDRDTLRTLLTAAARTPDHGKLEPFRFIVLEPKALARLAEIATRRGAAIGMAPDRIAKGRSQLEQGQLCVVVVESQKEHDTIPDLEQTYTAGAVCLALVNAALAAGWGANWLTGWMAHDRGFMREGLGLERHERIAGMIYLGTETSAPPERPRPDLDAITTWVDE